MGALLRFVFSSSAPIVALCLDAVWLSRRPSSAHLRRFAIAAALFYLFASLAIVPYGVSRLMTMGYHQFRGEDVAAGTTAIVLLGGGDDFIQGWTDEITVTTPSEAERVLEATRVFKLIAPAWIISSGGRPEPQDRGEPSAITMRDELVRLGVPRDRILLEARSRTTHDNAVLIVPILRSRGIQHVVLVTSATHMRRSLGAFRAVGVQAIPAAAPGGEAPSQWFEWLPSNNGLEWSGIIAHELGGIPYYWMRGWWRS
jgi:uncharacterized SAM-binding protein YcdF (DUF218 family)